MQSLQSEEEEEEKTKKLFQNFARLVQFFYRFA